MPSPANADIRCSTVDTRTPLFSRHEDRRVSPTAYGSALISTGCGEIDAAEHDAGIGRGRTQREIDLLAGVQADAGGADHVLQRALLDHEQPDVARIILAFEICDRSYARSNDTRT